MSYAKLTLSGPYRDTAPSDQTLRSRIADRKAFHFSTFAARVERLLQKKSVRLVIIDMHADFLPEFSAAAEQIRRELQRLQARGKVLHFCATQYRESALYLGSACDYRHIAPLGTVAFHGVGHSFVFLRRMLERRGVRAEVFRRGRYKSAADPFRTDTLDPNNEQQYQEFFDVKQREVVRVLAEAYRAPAAAIDQLLNGRVIHDEEAVAEGWVHDVTTVRDVTDRLKAEKQKAVRLKVGTAGYGKGKQVAVLFVEGPIVDGASRRHPLFGNATGAATVVEQINAIRKNKGCKAVVVRINSPGGSATASELIRYELQNLGEQKPLICSMSTVAASGGYWIATAGASVLAEQTTLTGSIGVVTLVLTASRLWHRLGITHKTVKTTPYQDIGSLLRSMTTEERALMEREIDRIYARFLQLVATSRRLDIEHVQQLAEGRVWDGAEALNQKLVDEIGGLPQAIDRAAALAGVRKPAVRFYPRVKSSLLERLIDGRSLGSTAVAWDAGPADLQAELRSLWRTPLLILPEAFHSFDALHSTLQSLQLSI